MKDWKITLGQLAAEDMGTLNNAKRAEGLMKDAAKRGSTLVVLPEMFLTGYNIAEQIKCCDAKEQLKKDVAKALAGLRKCSADTGVDLLISYALFEGENEKPYIALEYISKGETLALHRKINLCNYAQYTEHLNFIAGDEVVLAKTEQGTAGMFVCEDLWHGANALCAATRGAEAIFYSAVATVLDKNYGSACLNNWKKITVGTAFLETSYIICCNQAARGDVLSFGGSHVVAPDGEIVIQLPLFEESVGDVTLSGDYLRYIREMRPIVNNERPTVYTKYYK